MPRPRIDISQGLDGELVVLACFDLGEEQIAASSHAIAATAAERFRAASMSLDDVLELRELTALADELADLALPRGWRPTATPSRGSSRRATRPSGSARRTASRSRASAACSLRSRSSAPRRCAPRCRRRRVPADAGTRRPPSLRAPPGRRGERG
jgi:hypothetical protein